MAAKTFVLHDNSINTYGFRMLTEGADLSVFESNPVMLLNHDDWELPIGRWENIRKEGDKILADAVFDDADERALRVSGKVERGFLKAASIGAWPVELSDDPKVMLPGQKEPTVTKWIAREASICNIGANHNAVALYGSDNKAIDLLKPRALVSLYDNSYKDNNMSNQIDTNMNLKKLFKLSDVASDEAVSEAASNVLDENKTLKADKERLEAENKRLKDRVDAIEAKQKGDEKAEATKLVDQAITASRISSTAREIWLSDFESNFESAKTRLASIAARQSVSSQVNTDTDSEFVKLSWDELDKKGKLQQLKDSDPALFKMKYKERFGVEPSV